MSEKYASINLSALRASMACTGTALPFAHWVRGWVVLRAGLNVVGNRTPAVQPVTHNYVDPTGEVRDNLLRVGSIVLSECSQSSSVSPSDNSNMKCSVKPLRNRDHRILIFWINVELCNLGKIIWRLISELHGHGNAYINVFILTM
jgi:hypothetical protein